mgnify:CR=1 FL=1
MRDTELRFLLDENVKKELLKFLKSEGYDAAFKPKGLSNGELAAFSKSEQRILVSNDEHFTDPLKFPKDKLFSVVWLRVSQGNPGALLKSFSLLLKSKSKPEDFEGFLITLKDGDFEASEILSVSEFKFSKK